MPQIQRACTANNRPEFPRASYRLHNSRAVSDATFWGPRKAFELSTGVLPISLLREWPSKHQCRSSLTASA